MAHYMFPTSSTEGENYFVQFDIYALSLPMKDNEHMTETSKPVDADKAPTRGSLETLSQAREGQTFNYSALNPSEWQNTYKYETTANQLLHSIKLPLQMAPSEVTAGTYGDEATRDFQTIAKVLGGSGLSREEALGMVQDETVKSISKHMNRMQGKVKNQAMETFYGGPSKRDYSFNFSLIARNFRDSTELSKIIRRFHYHASPGASADAVFWSYPQMVRFFFLDKSGELIKLFSHSNSAFTQKSGAETKYASKACFINNVTAEYGVMGDQLRFLDEQNKRTGVANVKLTVNLKEAEYFTKRDYGIDDAN